ncbi:hypothetical protein TREMEDRAFT_60205 [Tremella mesenterica DSM 1558]|uniref:uncharacterized protein n=1 Tax=Tremella mesenterica (strain ATCC 24925 / CBS 8224 / DSM 1558 / NBRC 9311 / NRRL Y-6157 / RJB 2259-6 / UBC 559-6) TaxID=578456 RepID=UPI0003F4993D|nr:uncharacterized protein TREMEDRAFT_60205 [Tremella mesenterica DSM 1558]EIW71274.1 hypothetical protein TREMEDRAFT_60205 [Tremella mesenterica DSM 1558]
MSDLTTSDPVISMASQLPHPLIAPEIMSNILSFANKPTLAICLRTNKHLFDLAGPFLYRELSIDLTPSVNHTHRRPNDPLIGYDLDDSTVHMNPGTNITLKNLKLSLLRHTQIIKTTFIHDHIDETPFPKLSNLFPNCKVLILQGPNGPHHCSLQQCQVMKDFHITTLVLDRKGSPMPPSDDITYEKLVCILRPGGCLSDHVDFSRRLKDSRNSASLLKKITIINLPPNSMPMWRIPPYGDRPLIDYAMALHTLRKDGNVKVEIVNADCLDFQMPPEPDRRDSSEEHFQEAFFADVERLNKAGEGNRIISREELPIDLSRTRFMSMKEYVEEKDWFGVLSLEEVDRWLKETQMEKK